LEVGGIVRGEEEILMIPFSHHFRKIGYTKLGMFKVI
jgi:hypothetical protein